MSRRLALLAILLAPSLAAAGEPTLTGSLGGLAPLWSWRPGPWLGVEAGYEAPALRRVRPVLGFAYAGAGLSGSVTHAGLTEPASYRVREHLAQVHPGLRVELLDRREAIVPEIALAPAVLLATTVVTGESGGTPIPRQRESRARLGFFGAFALGGELERGTLLGQLAVTVLPAGGTIDGPGTLVAIVPTLAWRVKP